MLSSQLSGAAQAAGCELVAVESAELLVDEAQETDFKLVIVDLSTPVDIVTLVGRLKNSPAAPAIAAFAPHVHAAKLAAAQDAGCDEVLTRGQMHSNAQALFSRHCG